MGRGVDKRQQLNSVPKGRNLRGEPDESFRVGSTTPWDRRFRKAITMFETIRSRTICRHHTHRF